MDDAPTPLPERLSHRPTRHDALELALVAHCIVSPANIIGLGRLQLSPAAASLLELITELPGTAAAAGLEACARLACVDATALRMAREVDHLTVAEVAACGSLQAVIGMLRAPSYALRRAA